MRLLALVILAALPFTALSHAQVPQRSQVEREAELESLGWTRGGPVELPRSKGLLNVPPNLRQLVGKDVPKAWHALNGTIPPIGLEAIVHDPETNGYVTFQKLSVGYIKLDDWNDFDPERLIKVISETAEAANKERAKAGVSPIRTVRWHQIPQLDREKNVVHWAIEVVDGEGETAINSGALVFSRDGYECIVWVGGDPFESLLTVAEASFSLPQGNRYSDYRPGDRVAKARGAGLLTSTLAGTAVAHLGTTALVFITKNFFGLLLLMFAFGWAWFRVRRARKREAPGS
mgnify:CR=1 FL=1